MREQAHLVGLTARLEDGARLLARHFRLDDRRIGPAPSSRMRCSMRVSSSREKLARPRTRQKYAPSVGAECSMKTPRVRKQVRCGCDQQQGKRAAIDAGAVAVSERDRA
jgi:hypothetical protein